MLTRLSLTVLTALITGALWAAPPLTLIRDTVYKADGSRFTGQVIVEWRSFEAADTSFIGRQRLQFNVVDGLLSVKLVPTTTASGAAYYSVHYIADGRIQFAENWAVRPSVDSLRVRDIRISDPLMGPSLPGSGTTPGEVTIADVDGLQAELDVRVRKGASYTPGAAAVINAQGELIAASGNASDCVRVDGSSGPCGSGGGSGVFGTFVDGETPSGFINGSNSVFQLSQLPNPTSSLLLYRNGMLQKQGLDYSISSQTIAFISGAIPQSGDILLASYRTAGSGGTLTQVLCTGQGGSTSAASLQSLGTCAIPAGLLRPGDRIEILYDLAHGGSTTGFSFDVRWGATTVGARTVTAGTSLVTARATAGVHTTGAQLSSQSWGTGQSILSDLIASSDDINSALTVDFRAAMSAVTTDSVALKNFTVVRYPAP